MLRVLVMTAVPDVATMITHSLRRLGHEPVGVVGAHRRRPTPGLALLDESFKLPGVEVVVSPDKEAVDQIVKSFQPDLMLSWAFPWRIRQEALDVPSYGSINYHPSLLPRHRGANPVAWTIRMGDSHYGVTWHRMDSEYDSGPILAQRATAVHVEDTIFDVVPRLSAIGMRMLPSVLKRIADRDPGDPQPTHGATEAGPFEDDYVTIDWSKPAGSIHAQVRAWAFTPGTHSVVGPFGELDGERVRILRTTLQPDTKAQRVECGDGPIWILASEPSG